MRVCFCVLFYIFYDFGIAGAQGVYGKIGIVKIAVLAAFGQAARCVIARLGLTDQCIELFYGLINTALCQLLRGLLFCGFVLVLGVAAGILSLRATPIFIPPFS